MGAVCEDEEEGRRVEGEAGDYAVVEQKAVALTLVQAHKSR
jgi:hypothetical protein